ncbi:MAG TPA: TfoX/Sxy family protein [Gemmatimonadales bacterium]|nr:TfoX/Sxy family protein [Gemmatimonadales bacterium]
MAVTPGFRAFALEQLGRVATNLRSRSMFGGVGIYSAERFFALLDDDALYLKVDDESRAAFEAQGMAPFLPFGDGSHVMQYYGIPGDLLEDADALRPWVERALAAAGRKGRNRRSRDRPRRPR